MGKFRYVIDSQSIQGRVVEINAPDGWKDDELLLERSTTYKGVFRNFSANELTFTGVAAKTLRELFAQRQFEAEAEYIIYRKDFETDTESQYFRGDFVFKTFKDIQTNDSGKSVEITVIDSKFWDKIKNREKITPQLQFLESLDGGLFPGFANEEHFVTIPQVPKTLTSEVSTNESSSLVLQDAHVCPLNLVSNEGRGGAVSVQDLAFTGGIGNAFYEVPINVPNLNVKIVFNMKFIIQRPFGSSKFEISIKHYRPGAGLLTSTPLFEGVGTFTQQITVDSSWEILFPVQTSDYFILSVEQITGVFESVPPYNASVEIVADDFLLEETIISGMLIHEAFSRSLQITTGVSNPLYTELFGRKNSEPRSYAEDGEFSGILTTNGKRIRNFTKEESPMTIGFKDIFNSANALLPICAVIERIGGDDTLRVEKIKYAFDNRVVLTLGNVTDITRSVDERFVYNKVESGYKKAEYEEKDGLFEYNVKTERSTPVSAIERNYSIISDYRADDQGIGNARGKAKKNFPTEDTRYDTDIFMIKVIQNQSPLLNGDFESWLDDNDPEYWSTPILGQVERKVLLNSNRCYFKSSSQPSGLLAIRQSVVFAQVQAMSVKMSYQHVTDIPPGIKVGTLPIDAYFFLRLDTGSKIYHADASGKWIEGGNQYIEIASGMEAVKEAELQELLSFVLNLDPLPEPGTIRFTVYSNPGFVVDGIYLGAPQYIAETDENFPVVENAVNGDQSLNLDISPLRNFLRHGSLVRTGLEGSLSKKIKFNTSDKSTDLITRKTGEAAPLSETQDVEASDLEEPFLSPIKVEFSTEIGDGVVEELNSTFDGETKPKYLGLIKFKQKTDEDYSYMWIDKVESGGESGIGKISGIEISKYVVPVE